MVTGILENVAGVGADDGDCTGDAGRDVGTVLLVASLKLVVFEAVHAILIETGRRGLRQDMIHDQKHSHSGTA